MHRFLLRDYPLATLGDWLTKTACLHFIVHGQSEFKPKSISTSEIKLVAWRKFALAGNRTRAFRVAGENSTTEPPVLIREGSPVTREHCSFLTNLKLLIRRYPYTEIDPTQVNNNYSILSCFGCRCNSPVYCFWLCYHAK